MSDTNGSLTTITAIIMALSATRPRYLDIGETFLAPFLPPLTCCCNIERGVHILWADWSYPDSIPS